MRRMLDDPQLCLELKKDLLRSQAAASDYPAAEKLLQLKAALLDASRQPFTSDSGSTALKLAWQAAHPSWKLRLLGLLAGMGSLAAFQTWDSPGTAPSKTLPPPAAGIRPTHTGDALEVSSPSAASAGAEPAADSGTSAAAAPGRSATPAGVTQNAPSSSASRREIAQLVRIRELLNRDPAAAYRLALRSERQFPVGLLSEERQALAIVALAKTGATQNAQRKAREFFARHPQSPMRELIESALQ